MSKLNHSEHREQLILQILKHAEIDVTDVIKDQLFSRRKGSVLLVGLVGSLLYATKNVRRTQKSTSFRVEQRPYSRNAAEVVTTAEAEVATTVDQLDKTILDKFKAALQHCASHTKTLKETYDETVQGLVETGFNPADSSVVVWATSGHTVLNKTINGIDVQVALSETSDAAVIGTTNQSRTMPESVRSLIHQALPRHTDAANNVRDSISLRTVDLLQELDTLTRWLTQGVDAGTLLLKLMATGYVTGDEASLKVAGDILAHGEIKFRMTEPPARPVESVVNSEPEGETEEESDEENEEDEQVTT